MFIRVYALWHMNRDGDGTILETDLDLNPMHIVFTNVKSRRVHMSDGTVILTNETGVEQIRRSNLDATVGVLSI